MQKKLIKIRRTLLMLFALSIVLLPGCGRTVNRAAERRIRDALPGVLGSAKVYRVHVDNAPDRTVRGRLAHVIVDGEQVRLKNGLYFDTLHLELNGVEVDTGAGRVRAIKETKFTATVSAATVNEYIVGEDFKGEKLRNVRVAVGTEGITISAEREVVHVQPSILFKNPLTLWVPFQLTGPVHPVGARRLEIDATRLKVIGIPISGAPLTFLMQRFESGFDLNILPFPVTLTQVQTTPDKIILSGTADVSSLIQSQQARKP